jgi:hypothetical protein
MAYNPLRPSCEGQKLRETGLSEVEGGASRVNQTRIGSSFHLSPRWARRTLDGKLVIKTSDAGLHG